jgi:PAS domain S-box-containing protein
MWVGGAVVLGLMSWWFFAGDGVDRSRVYTIDYGNDVPFHFKGPDGAPAGLAVDLVREAARAKNIRLNWVREGEGSAATDPLRVLITVRTNLLKNLHLTEPYLQGRSSFIVASNAPIRTAGDLEGKRISYVNFAIHRLNLSRLFKTFAAVPTPSSREAVEKVSAGQSDAAFISDYAIEPACLNVALPFPVRIVPSQAPASRMALASRPEYARVADVLRDGIRDMAVDGRLERIVDRWGFFPNLITDRRDELIKEKRKVTYLQAAAGVLLLMVGLSGWLIARLRVNITERKLAELALKSSELKSRSIVESTPVPMAVYDDRQRITFLNHAFIKTLGYTLEDIPTLSDWWPKAYPDPSYRERAAVSWRAELDRSRQSGSEFPPMEVRVRAKDGTDRVVLAAASLLQGSRQGEHLVVLIDITDRKRQESERQDLESQLRHAQKMEAVGVLAGGIAHDFNNILAAIMGNAFLAVSDLARSHPVHAYLKEIQKASARATALVGQILTFSRKGAREQRALNLRPVVEEATRMLRSTIPAGVELTTRFASAPMALADPTEIHQLVINLGTNAWQAMDGRSGEIRLAVEGVTVDEDFARAHSDLRPGSYVRLTVSDNGHGMSPETLEHIFEPFFTTKEVGKGTGLGLAVVHGIMKGNRGAILVKSKLGEGTTFELYFPAAPEDRPPAPEPVSISASIAGQNRRILIIDDEEPLVRATTALLEKSGFRVTGFTRPEAGLEAFQSAPNLFDLVITDYNMPGYSGLELARKIQQIRPGTLVILTSGFITDRMRDEADSAGVTELTGKPITSDELLQIIHRLIRPAPTAGFPVGAG